MQLSGRAKTRIRIKRIVANRGMFGLHEKAYACGFRNGPLLRALKITVRKSSDLSCREVFLCLL